MNAPLVLAPVVQPKPWGREVWLNAARPEAAARIVGERRSLPELLRDEPALLGEASRALFGDELPIFTKFIEADFPPLVHVGFARAVTKDELAGWLSREQSLLRALFARLRLADRAAFVAFAAEYSTWATAQADTRWQTRDEAERARKLGPFVDGDVAPLLSSLRENRAAFVAVLNEVDLRHEVGNLLLTSAGILHAIFGLSHQTHPPDHSRRALEEIFARAKDRGDVVRLARAAGLEALRAQNCAAPKNEAWMPLILDGRLTLVEPQQSSDTTYSIADFYTPFVWKEGPRFRKGDARAGLSDAALAETLAGIDLAPTSLAKIRRSPVMLREAGGATWRVLVDEARAWPFFTAHRLELDGGARFAHDHAGAFQQIVVLDGDVAIDGGGATASLSREAPGFVPATLRGGYTLSSARGASLMIFSVPTS